MARALIIILSSVIITFGIYSLLVNRSITNSTENMSDYYRDVMVRNIANSMVEILQRKLLDNKNFRVQNWESTSLLGGSSKFRIIDTLANGDSVIKVNIIGNFEGKEKGIEVFYKIYPFGNDSIPMILNYAVFSGNSLTLNGNVTITNAGNGQNTDVHTNGNFSMNGSNKIEGFVTYSGTFSSNPPSGVNNITPINNPKNLPNHYRIAQLPIPEFNPSQYKNIATEIYYGDKIFNGNITLGTKENPKIIYVTGNLTLNGKIEGYGLFITEGRTIFNGDLTILNPDNYANNIGIFSGDKLIVNGRVKLSAQIFSNEEVIFNGNIEVEGSVISKEKVIFNGSSKVYYKPVNTQLTKYIFKPQQTKNTLLQIVYYYE